MEQMSLFDLNEEVSESVSEKLSVVKAQFIAGEQWSWPELFDGYDELYAITYSSGLAFTASVLKKFQQAEIIYGCEEVLPNGLSAVLALETSLIENFTKSKSAREMSERISAGSLSLYVSRNSISHEKVYCLKSEDGRCRVIVGSANLSKSAFEGHQRENIIYYDDPAAYEWYMNRYTHFREDCSDNVNEKVIIRTIDNPEYLREEPEEIPIIQTVKKKKLVFLEPSAEEDDAEIEIVTTAKNMEKELKPMLPKPAKDRGKIVLTMESLPKIHTVIKGMHTQKKERERQFPKLHLDYERESIGFNGAEYVLTPDMESVKRDIGCLDFYLTSLKSFHGDYDQAQKDYYRFFNWFFASLFMPYLRYVADKNSYDVTTLPVFGILYGDSNGGKSTFIQLLIKLMTGKKIPANPSSDFTYSTVEKLRCGIEGVPINFDDLDRHQFKTHADKIIKEDEWGIAERFFNYPAVVISTNKLPSLEAPIFKRVVGIRIDVRIGKEEGLKNSRNLKESLKNASTALFCEYFRRMIPQVKDMAERMKGGEEEYYADIFLLSSRTIRNIYNDVYETVPDYVRELSISDYFGAKVVGKNAIQKIREAWISEPQAFAIDKKKNMLTYTVPDHATYEINYLVDELPPQLNARKTPRSLIMDLDEAERFFEMRFRHGIIRRRHIG